MSHVPSSTGVIASDVVLGNVHRCRGAKVMCYDDPASRRAKLHGFALRKLDSGCVQRRLV